MRLSGRERWSATPAVLVCLAFLFTMLVFPASPAAAAGPALALTKSGSSSVLDGGTASFTLTAQNPDQTGAVPEYNISFRDELPPGISYVPGSTTPSVAGEPDVATAADGHQTLTWPDAYDLQVGEKQSVTFQVTLDPAVYPVGSTVPNTGNAYANTDPQAAPEFDADGNPVSGSYTESTTSNTTSTLVSALSVTKAEPSPEGELLRGVHDHSTIYTLNVKNSDAAATDGVSLVDYVPAGLEFMGCGTDDNSASPEYPGAGSLAQVPDVTSDCPTPTSVSTVSNPAGQPAGIYTRVEWQLGDLAPDQTVVVRYRAGIPQFANTLTFPGGTPSPSGLGQISNLDNNTGPSTRETATEQSMTNHVTVSGTYAGAVAPGTSPDVSDEAQASVTSEDLTLLKTVSPGEFSEGAIATYTLKVQTSEYDSAAAIVITDQLPDGLCPLSSTTNFDAASNAECDPAAGSDPAGAPGFGYDGDPVANRDGSFTIRFTPLELDANGTATVTFKARMRSTYASSGAPTSSGDSFTNRASLTGTTTTRPDVNPEPPGPSVTANDTSSATLTTNAPSVTKAIQPDVTPYSCSEDAGDYTSSPAAGDDVTFDKGSRVCFLVTARFSTESSTRNVVVSDLLPAGLLYEAGSAELTSANTTPAMLTNTAPPTWQLGTAEDGARFVDPGGVFQARFSVIVTRSAPGPAAARLKNQFKLRYQNSAGQVASLRAAVGLQVSPAPPATIDKSAERLSGTSPTGPLASGAVVGDGDVLRYTAAVGNGGTAGNANNEPIVGPDVWDVLPNGIRCADITTISDGGACTDPGQAGQPTFAGRDTLSAIRWDLPDTVSVAPGDQQALTYQLTVPSNASVALTYTNTASVASFGTTANHDGVVVQHRPAGNVDTTVPAAQIDAPAATDSFTVITQSLAVSKTNVTAIDAPGNLGAATGGQSAQAVIGEGVTYTITGRVPAHSSAYNAVLADAPPAGIDVVSASVSSSLDGGPQVPGTPAGFTFDASTGRLTFPTAETNTTDNDQVFVVTVNARVSKSGSNVHGAVLTNTASFSSTRGPGGDRVTLTAGSDVRVAEPDPQLTKTDDASGVVVGAQPVTYTLTARNQDPLSPGTVRPTLHDAFVVDCVPDGQDVQSVATPTQGTATFAPSDGTDGCTSGTTRIVWSLGDLAGGAAPTLTYVAVISPDATGLQVYTNRATLSGSSLDDDKTDPLAPDNPLERGYTATAQASVQVEPAAVAKTVDASTATIGERRTWTVKLTVPRNVSFFNAAVIDQIPAGIDLASLRTVSSTCVRADGVACTLSGNRLSNATGPNGSTLVGWNFGDVTSVPSVRILTLVYSGIVADVPASVRTTVLTNTAQAKWDLTNKATPTSAGASFDVASGAAAASVTVTEPSLGIDKTVSNPRPKSGETFTFSVKVSNSATLPDVSAAFDVQVTDTVPDGVVVAPGSISNGGVITGATSSGGGNISWTLPGPLTASAPVTLTYNARLSSPTPAGPLTNTADITHYQSLADGGRDYNGPQDTATVQAAVPHVTVAKAVVNGNVAYIGESKSFRVTVTSNGQATAYGVDVADVLPPNWLYDPGSAQVSVNGTPISGGAPTVSTASGVQTLTWTNLADVPVGQQLVIVYSATPQPGVVTRPGVGHSVNHTNTASVTAEDADGNQGPRGGSYAGPPASAVAHVDSADLAITKTHTGSPVAGSPFSWRVTVSNRGPDPAVGPFTVRDSLPPGLTNPTASGSGWTCSTSATTITCSRTSAADTLASGASFPVITVTGGVPAAAPNGTEVVNGVAVTDKTYDPATSNNTATDTAVVQTIADLGIVKTLSGTLVAGQQATYTLDVSNNGPSVSRGTITVTDTVPDGTTYVSASGGGWTVAQSGRLLTFTRAEQWPVGPLPQITITVRVDAGRTTPVVNTAHVSGETGDDNPSNDTSTVTDTPETSADLDLEKTHVGAFTAGSNATYRFTVTNLGPSDAQSTVRITDDLPPDVTFVGTTTPGWTCTSPDTKAVTCDLSGPLAVGATTQVDLTVAVAPGHTGNIINRATVTSPTTDPVPQNNTDADATGVDVVADLALTKSHAGTVTAGGEVTYDLTASNNGPSDSTGPLTVVDVLPDGMTYVSSSGTSWSCDAGPAGRVVTCTYAAGVASGQSAAGLTITAHVAADAGPATLVNRAAVDGPEFDSDPDLSNNSASDPTEIRDSAELSVTKTVTGDDPVDAGAGTSFDITVHNDGPSDADGVTVRDDLPDGMRIVSATGDGWTCGARTVISCSRPTVAAGADAPVIHVEVLVGSGVPDGTVLTNRATVSTTTPGDTPAGNTDTADVTVTTHDDLVLDKRHPTGTVIAGDETSYTLDVRNDGPSDAQAPLQIVDDLPPGFGYLSAGGGWDCAAAAAGDHQQVTCTLDLTLAPGQRAPTLTLTVLVSASVDSGTVTNTGVVSSPTDDAKPANNTDTADVTVSRSADLSVTKTHDEPIMVGQPATFHITVHNAGPSQARAVVLTDSLPEGLSYVSAEGDGWTCGDAGQVVTCTRSDPLGVDQDAPEITVVADVLPSAYPQVTNPASVDSQTPDAKPDNNRTTDPVTVPPLVNLTIDKSHVGTFAVGQRGRYRIEVANEGPTPDPGSATVTDVLPAGLTYVSGSGDGWQCDAAGQTVTCTHADGLAVGEHTTLELVVDVGPAAYPSLTNTADVQGTSPETSIEDNIDDDQVPVTPLVRLAIDKSLVTQTGTRATFDLAVTDKGPNDTVAPVVLVDDLPNGLHYVRATGPGWDCAAVTDTVTCTHEATIAVGDTSTVRLVTSIDAAPGVTITNVGVVSGGGARATAQDDARLTLPKPAGGGGGPGGGSGNGSGSGSGSGSGPGTLVNTGGPPLWIGLAGLVLLIGGVALMALDRRRRDA